MAAARERSPLEAATGIEQGEWAAEEGVERERVEIRCGEGGRAGWDGGLSGEEEGKEGVDQEMRR